MSGQTLFDKPKDEDDETKTLAPAKPVELISDTKSLTDLRSSAIALTPEQMIVALDTWWAHSGTFRAWIMSRLIEGVHYGHPPGTEPKLDENGWILQWNGKKQSYDKISPASWRPKKNLYKSGAEFICDLMQWLPMPETDINGWTMAGAKAGTYCIKCTVVRKQDRNHIEGIGYGICKESGHRRDDNAALKMAKKRALVDAVLTATGLSDEFTQDLDDAKKPARQNPSQKPDTVKSPTRGQRVSSEEINDLKKAWFEHLADHTKPKSVIAADFSKWVADMTGKKFEANKADQWTTVWMSSCFQAMGRPTEEELNSGHE